MSSEPSGARRLSAQQSVCTHALSINFCNRSRVFDFANANFRFLARRSGLLVGAPGRDPLLTFSLLGSEIFSQGSCSLIAEADNPYGIRMVTSPNHTISHQLAEVHCRSNSVD